MGEQFGSFMDYFKFTNLREDSSEDNSTFEENLRLSTSITVSFIYFTSLIVVLYKIRCNVFLRVGIVLTAYSIQFSTRLFIEITRVFSKND